MISPAHQRSLRRRLVSLSCLLSGCLALAVSARAQMGGVDSDPGSPGTGGRNIIEGRVYYPSGRNVDKRVKVKLISIRGGDFFTMSDTNGAFTFRRIAAGSYTVSIDAGSEFEPASEQVDVSDIISRGTELGRTFNLQIQLRAKATPNAKGSVFDAALAGVPKPAVDLYEKAKESLQGGNPQKAIEQLKQAIALYPKFALALNELGVVYGQLNELDNALAALRQAVNAAPDVFEIRLNLGLLLLKNKLYEQADRELGRAVELKESSTFAHLERAKVLIYLYKYPEAEKELQQIIKLGGNDVAMAYRFLGALYKERGDDQLAIDALEKYLSLDPKAKDANAVREIIKELRARVASRQ